MQKVHTPLIFVYLAYICAKYMYFHKSTYLLYIKSSW